MLLWTPLNGTGTYSDEMKTGQIGEQLKMEKLLLQRLENVVAP